MSEAMEKKKAKVDAFVRGILERLPPSDVYSENYLGWFECINTQHYYEAHDILEVIWHEGGRQHPNFAFYKGLIQLAGAFVHMQLHYRHPTHHIHGNRLEPSTRLFALAMKNLGAYPSPHDGLDLEATLALCRAYDEALKAGEFRVNPWTPETAPTLPFPDPARPSRPVVNGGPGGTKGSEPRAGA